MRSAVILTTFVVLAGFFFIRGLVPREAAATNRPEPEIITSPFEYADYDAEQSVSIIRQHEYAAPSEELSPPVRNETPADLTSIPPGQPNPTETPTPDKSQSDPEPNDRAIDSPAPVAVAGESTTTWIGAGEIRLNGSASTGQGLSYTWNQTSGPASLKIRNLASGKAIAAGLPLDPDVQDATYEFELTVADLHGRTDSDTVSIEVRTGPQLRVRPAARRTLALRDGYLLAHYTASGVNSSGYSELFEIHSPQQLSVHLLSGAGEYELAVKENDDGYVYQITVFYQEGEESNWLEFFIETTERIPAILQIGVTWE